MTLTGLLAQQRQWLEEVHPVALNPDRSNISSLYKVAPDADLACLKAALQELWRAQEALRATFASCAEGWQQRIAPDSDPVPYREIDLGALDADRRQEVALGLVAELDATLNLAHGPLARFVLFRLGDREPPRLLVIAHHIVSDASSMAVIERQIEQAYRHHKSGRTAPALKVAPYRECIELINALASSSELMTELDFWMRQPWEDFASLPYSKPDGRTSPIYHLDAVSRRITLHGLPRSSFPQPALQDIVQAAVADVFTAEAGGSLALQVAHNGRTLARSSAAVLPPTAVQTVGFFSVAAVNFLHPRDGRPIRDYVYQVKREAAGLPNGGAGYGLLRWLGPRGRIQERVETPGHEAQLSLNYLIAQPERSKRKLLERAESLPIHRDIFNPHPPLRLTLVETGNILDVVARYNTRSFDRSVIERLLDLCADAVVRYTHALA